MSDFDEMRWGTVGSSATTHGIHPATPEYEHEEYTSLCGRKLDNVGAADEPWDYASQDACASCRAKRVELIKSELT